jgi:predicted P-loop ATPase
MKIFSSLFKKRRKAMVLDASALQTLVATNKNTPVSAADSDKYLLALLTVYAGMLGVNFEQEDVTNILNVVNRSVSRLKGAEQPKNDDAEAPSKPSRPSQKRSDLGENYRKMLHNLDEYMVRFALRFNALTGNTEIAYPEEIEEGVTEMVYAPVSDRDISSMVQEVRCEGMDCWTQDIKRYLKSNNVKAYHPFIQYFEELPEWDGVDRITPLAERVSDSTVWVNGFHRWMLGVTAQWMGFARRKRGRAMVRANSVAPIIISEQQGWGKSTFCRMLVPEELQDYYTDSFDIKQPSACEAKLAEFGLINLDEFDSISPSRNAQLKNLMQMTALHVRKSHQSVTRNRFRLASFIGTSNSRDLLTDRSGSRRFLCVELDHPIDCDTPIEYAQLYAQLKQEILNGERYWFSSREEAEIQEANAVYYKTLTEEELFRRMYDEANRKTEGAVFMSAGEIFQELREQFPVQMVGMTSDAFAKILPTFANRARTNQHNGYWVVKK